jgi:hypothetical protein
MPLATNGRDDNFIQDMLLAAQATGRSASRVAMEAPCEAVFFNEGRLGVERLKRRKRSVDGDGDFQVR